MDDWFSCEYLIKRIAEVVLIDMNPSLAIAREAIVDSTPIKHGARWRNNHSFRRAPRSRSAGQTLLRVHQGGKRYLILPVMLSHNCGVLARVGVHVVEGDSKPLVPLMEPGHLWCIAIGVRTIGRDKDEYGGLVALEFGPGEIGSAFCVSNAHVYLGQAFGRAKKKQYRDYC